MRLIAIVGPMSRPHPAEAGEAHERTALLPDSSSKVPNSNVQVYGSGNVDSEQQGIVEDDTPTNYVSTSSQYQDTRSISPLIAVGVLTVGKTKRPPIQFCPV